jgi:ribonuclease BN (tRNA processing enzyme)
MATIQFKGVRGSYPLADAHATIGGNTTCVHVETGLEHIIFDAGTGLIALGDELALQKSGDHCLFLTHYHWDHICGLPYFSPLYREGHRVTLYGEQRRGVRGRGIVGPKETLEDQLGAPYFPLDDNFVRADLHEDIIKPGDIALLQSGMVEAVRLNHPQGGMGYILNIDDARAGFIWDHEYGVDEIDTALEERLQGVDVLVMDATYNDTEYANGRKGWGHSTNTTAAQVAKRVGAKQLVLMHHDPRHDDTKIEEMVREARVIFPNTVAAYEGMEIELGQDKEMEGDYGVQIMESGRLSGARC